MKLAWASRLGIALPIVLLLVAFAPAAHTPMPRERHSATLIDGIAMDGPRLAYAAPDARGLERIWIWNVLTGKQTRGNTATAYSGSSYLQLRGLAVDSHRTAWMLSTCGNSECLDDLCTSSSPTSPDRKVARADRMGDACSSGDDCVEGDWMMGLVGSRRPDRREPLVGRCGRERPAGRPRPAPRSRPAPDRLRAAGHRRVVRRRRAHRRPLARASRSTCTGPTRAPPSRCTRRPGASSARSPRCRRARSPCAATSCSS